MMNRAATTKCRFSIELLCPSQVLSFSRSSLELWNQSWRVNFLFECLRNRICSSLSLNFKLYLYLFIFGSKCVHPISILPQENSEHASAWLYLLRGSFAWWLYKVNIATSSLLIFKASDDSYWWWRAHCLCKLKCHWVSDDGVTLCEIGRHTSRCKSDSHVRNTLHDLSSMWSKLGMLLHKRTSLTQDMLLFEP